jgi:hypothetical protein
MSFVCAANTAGTLAVPFDLNWEALLDGWVPAIMLPTNLPSFGPGLRVVGSSVVGSLYMLDEIPTLG